MIKVINCRKQGNYKLDPIATDYSNPIDALTRMIEVHFHPFWRGSVILAEKERIVLSSRLFDSVDIEEFTGPEEEMRLLHLFISLNRDVDFYKKVVEAVPLGGDLNLNRDSRITLMRTLGLTSIPDIALGLHKSYKLDDLAAAAELAGKGLCSFKDALAMI